MRNSQATVFIAAADAGIQAETPFRWALEAQTGPQEEGRGFASAAEERDERFLSRRRRRDALSRPIARIAGR
jgi:hypothetical protein